LKAALQSAVALLSLMGGTIAVFILFYDVHDFRPHLPRIQALYAGMDPEDRNPPDNVLDFVQKAKEVMDQFCIHWLVVRITRSCAYECVALSFFYAGADAALAP